MLSHGLGGVPIGLPGGVTPGVLIPAPLGGEFGEYGGPEPKFFGGDMAQVKSL